MPGATSSSPMPESATRTRRPSRRAAWAGLFVVLFTVLFFGFDLGGRNLSSPDEGRYAEIPREMVASGDYVLPRLDGVLFFEKPPLLYWVEAAAIKLFGLGEWSLRLGPVLFAIFGCWLVFAAARRFYGTATGVTSALVLATTLLYYGLARFLVIDMMVSVLITATLFLFILGAEEPVPRRRRWYFRGVYVAAALAVMAKGLIGVLLPGLVGLVWIALTGRWRLVREILIPSGIILFLAIALPWHVAAALRHGDFLWFYFVHEQFLRFTTKIHSRTGPFLYFVPVVYFGFLPWSGYLWHGAKEAMPKSWAGRADKPVDLFLLLWVVLLFLFFSVSDSKLLTYILPIFPALAVLTGRAIAPYLTGERRGALPVGRVLVIANGFAAAVIILACWLAAPLARALRTALESGTIAPGTAYAGWTEKAIAGLTQAAVYCGIAAPIALPLSVALAIAAIAAIILSRRHGERPVIIIALLSAVIGWSAISAIAARVDPETVKPLALAMKPRLRDGDLVASFGRLRYDLPVYLERVVAFVPTDVPGEFKFGAAREDVSDILMPPAAFWKIWNSGRRGYVVMSRTRYERMRANPPGPLHLVAQTRNAVVLTNRPLEPPR